MKYLLQVDFPYQGPFKKEFTNMMRELALDIAQENGLVFKLWTENEENKEAGGVYLFDNLEDTKRYETKHTQRLENFGFSNIRTKVFEVNNELSVLSKCSFLD